MLMPRCVCRLGLALCLSGLAISAAHAEPQSTAVSRASSASVHASVEVPVAVFHALKAGGEFVLTGVSASARGAVATISVATAAGSHTLMVLVEPDALSGAPVTSVGRALKTSGGVFLSLGEEIIAFIPDPSAHSHIHSRRMSR